MLPKKGKMGAFAYNVLSQTIMTPDLKLVPIFSDDGSFDAEWSI